MPEETVQERSLEIMKFEEQMAKEAGLPSPKAMSILKQVCKEFVDSGFAPAHFQKNPAALFMAAMRGRELGLSPAEAIFETFWAAPRGGLGMYANKMLDLMHRGGVKTKFTKLSATECEIICTPPGDAEPYTAYFNIEEAKAAGLVRPDSNWLKWPLDMCKARAIARAYRALIGTFQGSGNFYAKEELEDLPENTAAPSPIEEKQQEAALEAEFNPGRPNGKVVEIHPTVDNSKATEIGQSLVKPDDRLAEERLAGSALWNNGSWVKERIGEVSEAFGHSNARSVNTFTKAFLGVSELPKGDPTIFEKPIIALKKLIREKEQRIGDWNLYLSSPVSLAVALRPKDISIKHPAQGVFDSFEWSEETQAKAKVLYAAIGFETAASFRDYCNSTGLDNMDAPNAIAFCRITSRILDANNLLRLSEEFNVSIVEILLQLESSRAQKVEDIKPAEIQAAIEATLQQVAAKHAPATEDELPFN